MPRAVNGLKQCCTCRETKPVSEYSKSKNRSDGLSYRCKCCYKQYRAVNREKILERKRQYYTENKEKIIEQNKQYYAENKEQKKQYYKQYRAKNREKLSENAKQYYQEVRKTEPYVYIATDRSTGYFYIGRTTRFIKERIRSHLQSQNTGLGKHMAEHNLTLDDLEIKQHHCPSAEESTVMERKLIAENIDNPLCLNRIQGW